MLRLWLRLASRKHILQVFGAGKTLQLQFLHGEHFSFMEDLNGTTWVMKNFNQFAVENQAFIEPAEKWACPVIFSTTGVG